MSGASRRQMRNRPLYETSGQASRQWTRARKEKTGIARETILRLAPALLALAIIMLATLAQRGLASETYNYGVPEGGELVVINSTRRTPNASSSTIANAGNVTQLSISGTTVSKTWQGYYGNITGTITLENAAGERIFTWNNPYPSGEVYATEASNVNWTDTNLHCYSFTEDSPTYLSLPEYEGWISDSPSYAGLGLSENSPDGIDETFTNSTSIGHTSFYTGVRYFNGSTSGGPTACPSMRTYNASGVAGSFEEVMIYSITDQRPIFVSIINQYGARGFDGRTWNFQMIVPVNGHDGSTESETVYYFYMELE